MIDDVDTESTLKPVQRQAIALLAGGMQPIRVAEAIGISRSQLWKWRNDPTFIAALNAELLESRQAVQNKLEAMVGSAVSVLESHLAQGSLRAAVQVLTGLGFFNERLRAIGPARASQVEAMQANETVLELLEARQQLASPMHRFALRSSQLDLFETEVSPSTGGDGAPG